MRSENANLFDVIAGPLLAGRNDWECILIHPRDAQHAFPGWATIEKVAFRRIPLRAREWVEPGYVNAEAKDGKTAVRMRYSVAMTRKELMYAAPYEAVGGPCLTKFN